MMKSLTLLTILTVVTATSGAVAQEDAHKTTQNQASNPNFLQGLSSIQEWATKLEAALRSQGNKIDQRKAKEQLLPKVIAIQKNLSDLEDLNANVVQDAGTDASTLNRDKMFDDTQALYSKILEVEKTFRELREGVQAISVPEITNIERIGEDALRTRGVEAYSALRILGYGNPGEGIPRIDYADLKARSDKITMLLHKAQDAFAQLHNYLAS
jgi:hypothetical protein